MERIKNLTIKNFRGIKKLSLDNLKPITVFLGENSIGKSTVLESLFMVTGPSHPFMTLNITNLRAHGNISMKEVAYLFHDANFSNTPHLEAEFSTHSRLIDLLPIFSIDESIDPNHLSVLGNYKQELTGFSSNFIIKGNDGSGHMGQSSFDRNKEGKLEPHFDPDYNETLMSVYLSPYNPSKDLLKVYDELVKSGKKDVILNAVKLFDTRITSIETTQEGLFLGYQHLENMVPLSIAGDGVQKYLCIAMYAFHPSINIIVIDEIENGLHFTAHQKLWKCIFESAKDLGKQFFISTHNKETLKCLSYFVENDDDSDMLNVITLVRTINDIVPYYISGYGLAGAIDNNLEIRKL